MLDGPSSQLTIDALNTTTPDLEHVMAYLYLYIYIYIYIDNALIPIPEGKSHQSSIDALNTATPNWAHLMADLYIYRQCTYTHGSWTPID